MLGVVFRSRETLHLLTFSASFCFCFKIEKKNVVDLGVVDIGLDSCGRDSHGQSDFGTTGCRITVERGLPYVELGKSDLALAQAVLKVLSVNDPPSLPLSLTSR